MGDEIVNVNGRALRGLGMEAARDALKAATKATVDLIIARAPEQMGVITGKGITCLCLGQN